MTRRGEELFWRDFSVLETFHCLGPSFLLRGHVEFSGSLQVLGRVIGSLRGVDEESALYLLEGGVIEGSIEVPLVTLQGSLKDVMIRARKVKILKGAQIFGVIEAEFLEVEEGAIFQGRVFRKRFQPQG